MRRITFVIVVVACFITTACSSDEEAKIAADAYFESMNSFDVSSLKVGSSDDFMASSISISSNPLLTDEEKRQASIELWKRYYFVSIGGHEDNICFAGNSYGYLYNNDEYLKNLIDKGIDRFGKKYIDKEFDKFVKTSDAYKHAITEGWCSPGDFKNNSVAKVAAIYCFSKDNKVLLDAINYLSIHLPGCNTDDIMIIKDDFINRFIIPTGDFVSIKEEKSTKLYVFKYYSYKKLLRFPTFYGLMNGMLNEVLENEMSKYQ